MLCLTRSVGQTIRIGENIYVTVLRMGRGKVMLGLAAPLDVEILRSELVRSQPGSEEPNEEEATDA